MWVEVAADEAAARDNLVDALHAERVRYLGGGQQPMTAPPMPPERLIMALAASSDARLRTALVALLMHHPPYAATAVQVAGTVEDPSLARNIRVSVLAAAALQRTWAFS